MSTSSNANTKGQGYVAAGTTIGSVIGSYFGPAGTWLGGSLGAAVGGIVGSLDIGGSAKRSAKKARTVQQERENNAQQAAYLQMIRQARLARSGSLAASASYGLSTSSLATSALSSIGAQSQYSVQYTANDQRLLQLYNKYIKKAGDYAKAAQTTLATGQFVSLAMGVGGAFAGATTATTATNEAGKSVTTYSLNQKALESGLDQVALMNNLMQPFYTGINQYNTQI